jgi:hypothetical protein
MTTITALPNQAAPGFWKRALGHRAFVIGAVLTLLLIAMAGLSLVWTPGSPYDVQMDKKLLPPQARSTGWAPTRMAATWHRCCWWARAAPSWWA